MGEIADAARELRETKELVLQQMPNARAEMDQIKADYGSFVGAGVHKAIFLDPAGDDAAPGTLTAPVKTLMRALAMVPNGGAGSIYAAPGTHLLSTDISKDAAIRIQPWNGDKTNVRIEQVPHVDDIGGNLRAKTGSIVSNQPIWMKDVNLITADFSQVEQDNPGLQHMHSAGFAPDHWNSTSSLTLVYCRIDCYDGPIVSGYGLGKQVAFRGCEMVGHGTTTQDDTLKRKPVFMRNGSFMFSGSLDGFAVEQGGINVGANILLPGNHDVMTNFEKVNY